MMTILKYKDYDGSAEIDMDRGVCRGKILFIDDLITYEAETPGALVDEFKAAVDDYLETCAELGIKPKTSLKGQFNVRISPAEHRAASIRARENGQSLNDFVRDCIVFGCSHDQGERVNLWSALSVQIKRQHRGSATSKSGKGAVAIKHQLASLEAYGLSAPAVMAFDSDVSNDVYEEEDEDSWSLPQGLSVLSNPSKLAN